MKIAIAIGLAVTFLALSAWWKRQAAVECLWRVARRLFSQMMDRFGRHILIARGFVWQDWSDRKLAESDERAVLTALLFALEVLEESGDPRVATRAHLHLEAVARARLHRRRMDWIRELPRARVKTAPNTHPSDGGPAEIAWEDIPC